MKIYLQFVITLAIGVFSLGIACPWLFSQPSTFTVAAGLLLLLLTPVLLFLSTRRTIHYIIVAVQEARDREAALQDAEPVQAKYPARNIFSSKTHQD